jgi:hypothetical protein
MPISWLIWLISAYSSEIQPALAALAPETAARCSETAARWQVKICGEEGDDNQTTPFSNIISSGPLLA